MTAKSKIIFVNRFYAPDESATSVMLADLIAGLDRAAYDITVVTGSSFYTSDLGHLPKREVRDGVSIRRVASLRLFNGSILGRLVNYLLFHLLAALVLVKRLKRGDIVVCLTDPPLLSVTVFLPTLIKGAKLVNWVQDIYPEVALTLKFAGPMGELARILQPLRDFVWRRSAMNVVIGERMRGFLQAHGVPSDRISVVPNWSDDGALKPVADHGTGIRAEWGLSEDDFVVMYSGNLGRAHDISTIAQAMRELDRSGAHNIKFVFVGGGAQSDALRAIVEAEGLHCARFYPYRPKAELGQSLSVGNVHWISLDPDLEGLIVPSKFYGVCAVARPSIFVGGREGELSGLLGQAECGWHVEQGDGAGLAKLLFDLSNSPSEVSKAGNNARLALEARFSRSRRIDQWHLVIEGVGAQTLVDGASAQPDKSFEAERSVEPAE